MKFQKTIDLWAEGTQERIVNGELRLQTGQWCTTGNPRKCRFVSHNGRTINVVHWQGTGKATADLFALRVRVKRSRI
jgi:hypothetical protein